MRHEGVLIRMTSDRTDVPHPTDSDTHRVSDTHEQSHAAPAVQHDTEPETASAHLGAVEGETTPIIPPMHDSSSDDAIDPTDEITPG